MFHLWSYSCNMLQVKMLAVGKGPIHLDIFLLSSESGFGPIGLHGPDDRCGLLNGMNNTEMSYSALCVPVTFLVCVPYVT